MPIWKAENGRTKREPTPFKGVAGGFVKAVGGSYPNVVGLPLYETANLLRAAGYPIP